MKAVTTIVLIFAIAASSFCAWQLLRARTETRVYEKQWEALNSDYQDLLAQYNEAVRKTAVTELLVDQDNITVVVRTIEGDKKTIDTGLSPAGEVYVDYVVIDNRLWIRRIFDENTPPAKAVTIDPRFAQVDWDRENAVVGKAVYRRLSPGRWGISVTGDGSLGLKRLAEDQPFDVASPPAVREYDEQKDISPATRKPGTKEMLRAIVEP